MGTELKFKSDLIAPLAECYGSNKFPAIRVHAIWSRVRSLPDHLYKILSEKIILNHDNFPGMAGIMAVCNEATNEFAAKESEKIKAALKCFRCRSQGVITIGVYAYRCGCALGGLLYPNYREFSGEVEHGERTSLDNGGLVSTETGTHIFSSRQGAKSVREFSFIIKERP